MTEVHIINHTHWDREWFLTHEYTTEWVPPLIDALEKLAAENPAYEFLLDGQTLAIEDLLRIRPDYRPRVEALISRGQLGIGPCYSQPDWRMASGELHIRNLIMGLADARSLGGEPRVAWLVDTFGHISQAPQLLSMAGLDAAYVWRGVPELEPVFRWRGSDGSELLTIDLFGGYRNLYGITKTPDIAVDRLVAETDKLASAYRGLPVPLFDGYDLDTEPEDPARYYAQLSVPARISLHASSPTSYAGAVADHARSAPILDGELISGKYGATFPGTLSARTYLKVLHHDAENALHRRVEPLGVLATARGRAFDAERYEQLNRELLQNAVHDCLCGVSIDQVHERMERSYRHVLEWADHEQAALATSILAGFAPGSYAISTNAMPIHTVLRAGAYAIEVETAAIGVGPVVRAVPVTSTNEPGDRFEWTNDHYRVVVDADGITLDGVGRIGRLVVREDSGDTYSSEPGDVLGELRPSGQPVRVDRSALDTTIRISCHLATGDIEVNATLDARFDDGPTVDLTVTLDSTGTGFRVDADFETSIASSTVHAGMPFDLVERAHADTDLLDHRIDPELASILMGQRETGMITEYPFHDMVALADSAVTRAVHAKGLRSYRSSDDGVISVTLRRAVEWLAHTDLQFRSGDAGPAMYVPGARCERTVEHRLAFSVLEGPLEASGLVHHNEAFQNPPTIATVEGSAGDGPTSWAVLSAPVPVASLAMRNGIPAARMYNPTRTEQQMPAVIGLDIDGQNESVVEAIASKKIMTARVVIELMEAETAGSSVQVLSPIVNRVGPSQSRPDANVLDQLRARIDELTAELKQAASQLTVSEGNDRYRLVHREYVLDRERLELMLSLELNERRQVSTDEVSIPDDADPTIAELGQRLNDLRVKRRIYDYVVQALPA